MLNRKWQVGVGLLELMLSLTVVVILLVMATQYYGTVRTNYRVHEGLGIIQAVYAASESWLQHSPSIPTGVNGARKAFIDYGSLPKNIADTNANPWGGGITLEGSATTTIKITMSNVPAADCNNLIAKLQQKLTADVVTNPLCDSNSLVVTLNLAAST